MGDMMFMIPICGAIAVATAAYLVYNVLKEPDGNERMQEVANAIREGAMAFLGRQYRTIAVLSVVLAALIWVVYSATGKGEYGAKTAIAFLVGAFCSGLAGYIGMW